jgi:hypothetical protein
MRTFARWAVPLLLTMGFVAAAGSQSNDSRIAASGVYVNGQQLTADTVQRLQVRYGQSIGPGRYWYDGMTGATGHEGGLASQQIDAGLNLGGALRSDASRGTSGVFINGRQLTTYETISIRQACQVPVQRGRYWMNADGIGGVEGGPAISSLAACVNRSVVVSRSGRTAA